ncbi:unnamed protein product [Caretta caretta]
MNLQLNSFEVVLCARTKVTKGRVCILHCGLQNSQAAFSVRSCGCLPKGPAVPEGHELFSTSGDPKEQPHILGTSALVEDSAVPRRALLKEAHHQEKAKGCSLL